MTIDEFIDKFRPCMAARRYLVHCNSMAQAWDEVPRADWLIWAQVAVDCPTDAELRRFALWSVLNTPMGDGTLTGAQITDQRSLRAVELATGYLEGRCLEVDMRGAQEPATAVEIEYAGDRARMGPEYLMAVAASACVETDADEAVQLAVTYSALAAHKTYDAREFQAREWRRRFPNPFKRTTT